jgi:hypothetical protein
MTDQNQDYINGACFHLTIAVNQSQNIEGDETPLKYDKLIGLTIYSIFAAFCITYTGYNIIAPQKCENNYLTRSCEKDISLNFINIIAFIFLTFINLGILLGLMVTLKDPTILNALTSDETRKSLQMAIDDLNKIETVDPEVYGVFIEQMTTLLSQVEVDRKDPNYIPICSQKAKIGSLLINSSHLLINSEQ